jgi:2,3-bisphosphoglycerate-independent phosphoglycerate mutase
MDRDKRWDRVSLAYEAIVAGKGARAEDPVAAIHASYNAGKTDEFIIPTCIGPYAGMATGDGLVMANFRADRARQMLTTLLDPKFDGFERSRVPTFAAKIGMASYSDVIDPMLDGLLFPPESLDHILGQEVAEAGLKQFRVAETEKYAHVTFFLNGGREEPFPGEDRVIVPSSKVATYDLKPEMSAPAVTEKLVEAIGAGKYSLIVANFANPDMVGHTGKLDAAIEAVDTIDTCLGKVTRAVEKAGGALLVTADHGNVEMMKDPVTGQPHTAHTTGPVPIVALGTGARSLSDGSLCDVAPTLLALLGLPQPKAMTGHSLLPAQHVERRAS